MKVTFDLTLQDYIDFTVFHSKNSKRLKFQVETYRIFTSLIPIIIGLIIMWFDDSNDVYLMIFSSLISIIVFFYLPKYFYDDMIKTEVFNNDIILGKKTLEFYDDIMRFNNINLRYDSITCIKQSDSAIYLFRSYMSVFIIPFRVFELDEQKQEFIDYINSKIVSKMLID